jgi:hypothetical protein
VSCTAARCRPAAQARERERPSLPVPAARAVDACRDWARAGSAPRRARPADLRPPGGAPSLAGVADPGRGRRARRPRGAQGGPEAMRRRSDRRSSAARGLERVQQWRPTVIVSDIGMPGEDGYTLIRKVREWELAKGSRGPRPWLSPPTRGRTIASARWSRDTRCTWRSRSTHRAGARHRGRSPAAGPRKHEAPGLTGGRVGLPRMSGRRGGRVVALKPALWLSV